MSETNSPNKPGRPRKLFLDDADSLRRFRDAVRGQVGSNPTVKQLGDLARKASAVHGPGVKWTGSYLYGLLRGYPDYRLRPELLVALESCTGTRHVESIMLRVDDTVKVEPGTTVLVSSRRCPKCNRPFIPRVYNQKLCGSPCKRR